MITSFPFLNQITFTRLRVTFEAAEPLVLTEYPGSALRSCMMQAFFALICPKKYKKCVNESCDERYSCSFSILFNSFSLPEHPHHTKYISTPPPYIIEPFNAHQTVFKKEEKFGFDFTLIGKGIKYLPLALSSFQKMGEMGIGRGRGKFRFIGLESLKADMEYEPVSLFAQPEVLSLSKLKIPSVKNKLIIEQQIEFRTKTDKGYNDKAPSFHIFTKRLTTRLSLLAHFHCGAEWKDIYDDEFITEVEMKEEGTQIEHLERKTRTMNEIMNMDGPVGRFIYEGEGLNNWMPLITMGSWLHVGSTANMGLGKYIIIND